MNYHSLTFAELVSLKQMILFLIKCAFAFFIIYNIQYYFKNIKKSIVVTRRILRNVTLKKYSIVLGFLIFTFTFLYAFRHIKILQYNLFSFLGNSQNLTFGLVDFKSTTLLLSIFSILVFILMIIIMPELVMIEENIFRKNKLKLIERIKSSIIFGLVHLVCGITILQSIALIFMGFFLSIIYKSSYIKNNCTPKNDHKAILESSTIHFLYNATLISILLILYTIQTIGIHII